MKLLSLKYLSTRAKASFLRFPLTIIAALFSVCISVYLSNVDDYGTFDEIQLINLSLTGALGIPLYFCISIFTEKSAFSKQKKRLAQLAGSLLLVLVYFSLPDTTVSNNTSLPYVRYTIFNIIAHLLVSFAPYLKTKELNGFWNYNKTLFIRFWTSVLYSGFLYLGIVLAFALVDVLFDVKINGKRYFQVFIVISGFFNTWFFVSGIPKNLSQLEDIREYPKGLKIFAQYILLPLLIIYFVILYLYGAKIMYTWDWPKGIVSYLIASVSIIGILTLLLLHPYGYLKENAWIQKLTRIYYYLLFPLILMLSIAIWFRIEDYGVTINRYIIVLLVFWLFAVATYISIGKKNIKFIPISLAVLMICTVFGPWGMFTVSEKSQFNRLKTILATHDLILDDKIVNEVMWHRDSLPKFKAEHMDVNDNILGDSLHNEVKSIVDYLTDHHGIATLNSMFQQDISSMIHSAMDSVKYINEAKIVMNTMGLPSTRKYKFSSKSRFSYHSGKQDFIVASGYDYIIDFTCAKYRDDKHFTLEGVDYWFTYDDLLENEFILHSAQENIVFGISELVDTLYTKHGANRTTELGKANMSLYGSSENYKAKVELTSINLMEREGEISIDVVSGKVFLRKLK